MKSPFPAVTATHLDLFSGIGGFAIATQNCGYTTVGFCEREPYAQQILKERFGAVLADCDGRRLMESKHAQERGEGVEAGQCARNSPPRIHPDIFTLNGADYRGVDLLTGGFPCQPFSVAGKRKGAADDRAIWPEMLRVINEARPTWIIGENVAGIVTMELDNILSDLESLGYSAWPLVIPACAVDARHRRDRVWIIGRRLLCSDPGRNQRAESKRQHERAEVGGGSGTNELEAGADVAHAAQREDDRRKGGELASAERCGKGQHAPFVAGREDVAHADGSGQRQSHEEDAERASKQPYCGGIQQPNVADASSQRLQGKLHPRGDDTEGRQEPYGRASASSGIPCGWKPESQWFAESGMGRVAHGIPHRAHRLRGLGNAIVPQVAEEIIRAIASLR